MFRKLEKNNKNLYITKNVSKNKPQNNIIFQPSFTNNVIRWTSLNKNIINKRIKN